MVMAATASVGEEWIVLLMGAAGFELRRLGPAGVTDLRCVGADEDIGHLRDHALFEDDLAA
ncbi:hypothetical protein [Brevundimonas mediterranea]|uniref:hypothetical protein n=1 Tax=Brevundimonas mediterranea TaxID=74329 RepID=UPI0012B6A06F|nr:hypothetical protein [Brevundimonas mediterranea]